MTLSMLVRQSLGEGGEETTPHQECWSLLGRRGGGDRGTFDAPECVTASRDDGDPEGRPNTPDYFEYFLLFVEPFYTWAKNGVQEGKNKM